MSAHASQKLTYAYTLAQSKTHTPHPSCARCSTCLCTSLYSQMTGHIPAAKENRTLNEKGRGETNLWFEFERSFRSSKTTTGNTYSCQLLTQILNLQGGSQGRMWHEETSDSAVKVVRAHRRWLTLLHCPLQIMMGFFHRWQWHLACKHPAPLPRLSQMLLSLCI